MEDRSDFNSRNNYHKEVASTGRFRARQTKFVIAATKELLSKMTQQTILLDKLIEKYQLNSVKQLVSQQLVE